MLKKKNISLLLLRLALAVILIMHSVPGMFNGGVTAFGELYLNNVGFAPIGVLIAYIIKISHVLSAILFILNKYNKLNCQINILFFILGIIMVHWENGWFVVGGGNNGIEYNFLIICVLFSILCSEYKETDKKKAKTKWFQ